MAESGLLQENGFLFLRFTSFIYLFIVCKQ